MGVQQGELNSNSDCRIGYCTEVTQKSLLQGSVGFEKTYGYGTIMQLMAVNQGGRHYWFAENLKARI